MRRVLIGTVAALAVLLVVAQVVLPRRIGGDLERQFERDGGSVDVELSAWPAPTLLLGRGRSIDIAGGDLDVDLSRPGGRPFDRLDGFARVRMRLTSVEVGPLALRSLSLERPGRGDAYHLRLDGSTTPRDLARALGSREGGLLGGLAGSLAGGTLPGNGERKVAFQVDARLDSSDGRARVRAADGSVAGLPTGPLAEIVLGAVLARV